MTMTSLTWVLIPSFVSVALAGSPQAVEKKDLLGCWQRSDDKPDEMLRFEANRFINAGKDYSQIMPVVYEKGKVFLASNGQRVEMELTLKDGVLTVKNG